MSMVSELTYFLSVQVEKSSDGYFISQEEYLIILVKKFELELYKPTRTPVSTSTKLSKDDCGKTIDPTMYKRLIGSLLYLTTSCPNIMHSIGMFARYQASPKESHLIVAKHILSYVNGTRNYGLWYTKGSELNLTRFCDDD